MKLLSKTLLATGLATAFCGAQAAIVLDFERIAPYPNNNNVFVQNYYNGGTSSIGSSGTNYGISFSSNSLLICLNTLNVFCSNTSRGGQAPGSEQGGLFFLQGGASIMNVAAGFDTGFSFNYSAANQGGSVSVFDGLDGTGNLLATLNLTTNPGSCPGYGAGFCPFSGIGVAFAGIAKSVSFAGGANQIVFDDITLGSVTPGGNVPEPGALALAGIAFLGAAAARRRQKA